MQNKFSPNEQEIIRILGRKKLRITDIAKQMYSNEDARLHGQTTVANAIRRINLKCEKFKLSWRLLGRGLGRNGKLIWKARV